MTAWYNEIDEYAAQWLRNLMKEGLIADGIVDTRSIVAVEAADLRDFDQCHFFAGIGVWSHALRRAGWRDDCPVWTGSCPCQPFSAAGKGKGFDDERHLWPEFHRLIRECQPGVVFGEQVASKDGLVWLDTVCADMEGTGYAIGAVDLCAAGVGAPHIRQRLWFAAERLADTESSGSRARLRDHEQTGQRGHVVADDDATRRVADADGGHPGAEWEQRGGQQRQQPEDGGAGDSIGPGPVNGHWGDADWLFCRDGKWRPVEPGTFPLAHGASFKLGSGGTLEGKSRVGMLRAYGNAIVASVATEVITAYMECRP